MGIVQRHGRGGETLIKMQIATVSGLAITVGWLVALVVLIIAILGLVGVVPLGQTVVFGLFAALAVARLI